MLNSVIHLLSSSALSSGVLIFERTNPPSLKGEKISEITYQIIQKYTSRYDKYFLTTQNSLKVYLQL